MSDRQSLKNVSHQARLQDYFHKSGWLWLSSPLPHVNDGQMIRPPLFLELGGDDACVFALGDSRRSCTACTHLSSHQSHTPRKSLGCDCAWC